MAIRQQSVSVSSTRPATTGLVAAANLAAGGGLFYAFVGWLVDTLPTLTQMARKPRADRQQHNNRRTKDTMRFINRKTLAIAGAAAALVAVGSTGTAVAGSLIGSADIKDGAVTAST